MVRCSTQQEIDYFWSKLSADRKAGQCGWLKDKFGVSWQIVPTVVDEMLQDKNETKLARVTEAFLKMKKSDIAKLKEAYGQGRSAAYPDIQESRTVQFHQVFTWEENTNSRTSLWMQVAGSPSP